MKDEKLIIKTVKELLKKMTTGQVDIEIKKQENSPVLIVSVQLEDAGQFIGQGGSNLNDLQRILRLLVAKKDPEAPLFFIRY